MAAGNQVRALALDTALRNERNRLRMVGGPDNIRITNTLNDYVQNGDDESKALVWQQIADQARGRA